MSGSGGGATGDETVDMKRKRERRDKRLQDFIKAQGRILINQLEALANNRVPKKQVNIYAAFDLMHKQEGRFK